MSFQGHEGTIFGEVIQRFGVHPEPHKLYLLKEYQPQLTKGNTSVEPKFFRILYEQKFTSL